MKNLVLLLEVLMRNQWNSLFCGAVLMMLSVTIAQAESTLKEQLTKIPPAQKTALFDCYFTSKTISQCSGIGDEYKNSDLVKILLSTSKINQSIFPPRWWMGGGIWTPSSADFASGSN